MKAPILIVGIGELGGVFARAFLRSGHPVCPVTRQTDMTTIGEPFLNPELCLVAVGEKALPDILSGLPQNHRQNLGLLQNELLPNAWKAFQIDHPTVISVWFEKKKGQGIKILKPSPVFGPKATLIADALSALDIPCDILKQERDLVFELAVKNVFVFTINICGMKLGGTTGNLWSNHHSLAVKVADEVMRVQEKLTGETFSREHVYKKFEEGVSGDPNHKCTGRSAPGRLTRLISKAQKAGVEVPTIRDIQAIIENNR
jgi:ketopantoate reductase